MKNSSLLKSSLVILVFCLSLAGCGKKEETNTTSVTEDGLIPIVLQTDWYAQAEHGGFYQALAEGFYEEEGLAVEIIPGGPNSITTQKIAQGFAQFAIGRSDDMIISYARGIPLVICGSLMQKDPQAIMFHKEGGITEFKDLDKRPIMTTPGTAFVQILEKKYDITIPVIPLDYGMSRFLSDKQFVQQAFITNEPYYVAKEGANVETLLLSDLGFSPYRVWFTSKSFARKNPEAVAAFTRASIKGWISYMTEDRTKANELIGSLNPKMTDEFLEYSHSAMLRYKLVQGNDDDWSTVGEVLPERIQEQIQQLVDIGMIPEKIPAESLLQF